MSDYLIMLYPREKPAKADVWAFSVRHKRPAIAAPFEVGVAPVLLDLRACIERA